MRVTSNRSSTSMCKIDLDLKCNYFHQGKRGLKEERRLEPLFCGNKTELNKLLEGVNAKYDVSRFFLACV